jgi:hypothetical protein
MPGASGAPVASRAKSKKHTSVVTTGSPERAGIPCANGFNGLLRALPGEPGLLSPSPAQCEHCGWLDISVGISGPHDFAVRFTRIRLVPASVHRIPHPTSVTIAIRPSYRGGTALILPVIWAHGQRPATAANWHDGQIRRRRQNSVKCQANAASHVIASASQRAARMRAR